MNCALAQLGHSTYRRGARIDLFLEWNAPYLASAIRELKSEFRRIPPDKSILHPV